MTRYVCTSLFTQNKHYFCCGHMVSGVARFASRTSLRAMSAVYQFVSSAVYMRLATARLPSSARTGSSLGKTGYQ